MLDAEIVNALEAKYGPRRQSEWDHEKVELEASLEEIAEILAPRYRILRPIGVGGAGVTVLMRDGSLSVSGDDGSLQKEAFVVLKLSRPTTDAETDLNAIVLKEMERLALVRHPNIIKILHRGTTPVGRHFYLMEYLDGVQDAHEYLAANPTEENLLRVALGAASGVAHMHANGLRHLDIKPQNIFVSSSGEVAVADFGFTKLVKSENGISHGFGGTFGYKHPEYEAFLTQLSESHTRRADPNREMAIDSELMDTSSFREEFDIYSLGLTFLILLRVVMLKNGASVSKYAYRYLRLLSHRMLDGQLTYAKAMSQEVLHGLEKESWWPEGDLGDLVDDSNVAGFNQQSIGEISVRDMGEVVECLRKMSGDYNIGERVHELSHSPRNLIQASSFGPVTFTPRVRALLDVPEMRAIGRVEQLGLVRLVYPNATHSRLEHALGAYHLAVRYARALFDDGVSPLFRQLMGERELSLLFACALIHDCGHYAFAHDLEEVDVRCFSHEARALSLLGSGSLIQDVLSARTLNDGSPGWGLDVSDVKAVLSGHGTSAGSQPVVRLGVRYQILRSILSGPLDCDKVDYLTRDSQNLRLPYGDGIDVEKLIASLTVIVETRGGYGEGRIGILEKGRIPAESLAFARYAMYGSVYWHKTHRALKALLGRLALEAVYRSQIGRRGWRSDVRKALYGLLAARPEPAAQEELPVEGWSPVGAAEPGPYLDDPSTEILGWLVAAAGPECAHLASDLANRRIYRKVLVVSKSRSTPGTWAKIESVFGVFGDKALERRQVMVKLQELMVLAVQDGKSPVMPHFTAAAVGLSEEFVERASTRRPLVLVDYPAPKSGADTGLQYLREDEWSGEAPGSLEIFPIGESSLWSVLARQQNESNAKLRVFIHPKYAAMLKGKLGRQGILDLLVQAIDAAGDLDDEA